MLVKSKVKYIQSLGQKKSRDEAGLFIAEGPKIVGELLHEYSSLVKSVYGLPEWIERHQAEHKMVTMEAVSPMELEKISQLQTPNQVLAIVEQLPVQSNINSDGRLTLVLDTIQDPGNLGTLIRIADWFGIGNIVCSPECADQYNPKVVQSTMGSIARVNVLYTSLHEWLTSQKVPVFAAALHGEDITKMDKPKEGIIIIGNESKGIHPEILELVKRKITIPQIGKAESLNAAVAAGIILSHLVQS